MSFFINHLQQRLAVSQSSHTKKTIYAKEINRHRKKVISNAMEATTKLLKKAPESTVHDVLVATVGCSEESATSLINLAKDYMRISNQLSYDEMKAEAELNAFEAEKC
jgi:hypothetical protein